MKHRKLWGRVVAVILSVMLVVQTAIIPTFAMDLSSWGNWASFFNGGKTSQTTTTTTDETTTAASDTTTAAASGTTTTAAATKSNSVAVQADTTKTETKIALKSDVSITYTYDEDASTLKKAIFDSVVDTANSTLPSGITYTDLTYEYETTGKSGWLFKKAYYPIEGGTVSGSLGVTYKAGAMGAGENQKIKVSYKGSDTYTEASVEGTVTVAKGSVSVKVSPKFIYAEDGIPDDFVTTTPERDVLADKDFDITTIYYGVTSGLSGIVYVQLPDSITNAITKIDPLLEAVGQTSLTKTLDEGTTVADLITNLNTINDTIQKYPALQESLKKLGIDTDTFNTIVTALNKLPDNMKDFTVAIGEPSKAGTYLATATTGATDNYNSASGSGLLHIKMHVQNVKMSWNNDSPSKAGDDFTASIYYNSEKMSGTYKQATGIKYRFVGVTSDYKIYRSSDAPTANGTYLETAYVFGGNYLATPLIRIVTLA